MVDKFYNIKENNVNKSLLVIALTFLVFNISCKKSPTSSENTAPIASFTVNPTSGTTTTFAFDASGSSDNEDAATVLQVRWDWNNSGTYNTNYSTTQTATHQYPIPGTYTVMLEVKDTGGLTNTTTKTVNVSDANTAPIASFTVNPTLGTTTTTFAFDASGSSDNEDAATVLQVRWDWENDGTYNTNYSTTQTATHQYTTPGTYTVMLEIKDTGGLTNTTTKTVNVQQQSTGVTFPDANFETLIRETLNKPTGDITNTDLATITELNGDSKNIYNISGIEHCTNLQGLTLSFNQIIDISALSGLTNLQGLTLWSNQIIDISALSGLTNLTILYLSDNQIIDIYPLIQNSGIDNDDEVNISYNPLSETSINTYIPQLEARGVNVYYGYGKVRNKTIDISNSLKRFSEYAK